MTAKQMTLTLIASVVIAGIIASGLRGQQDRTASNNGRYTLAQVEYIIIGQNGGETVHRAVFKLDTATGATWEYTSYLRPDKNGKYLVGWTALNDVPK
jgi:hypothetical protein